jgi:hypothetical protein
VCVCVHVYMIFSLSILILIPLCVHACIHMYVSAHACVSVLSMSCCTRSRARTPRSNVWVFWMHVPQAYMSAKNASRMPHQCFQMSEKVGDDLDSKILSLHTQHCARFTRTPTVSLLKSSERAGSTTYSSARIDVTSAWNINVIGVLYTCASMCLCVYIYIYVCVYMCVYVYIHEYIHMYT